MIKCLRVCVWPAMLGWVLGALIAGLMLLIQMFVPIPFITRFWWIPPVAVVFGLYSTLLQSWGWKAATRRFENWDSLDLDEQRAA